MAINNKVIIQHRRGAMSDFDPAKMSPGELAVTTDGSRKVFAAFEAGNVKELASKEEVENEIQGAVKAIQDAGAAEVGKLAAAGNTQIGNVSAEGAKQVQAAKDAAAAIVADRQQIQKNKTDIETLQHGKADAIINSASGEQIVLTDSDEEPFVGFRIFGKSTQNGVPSPAAPVPIVSTGDKGSVKVEVTGKNLLNTSNINVTHNGVTFKSESDDSVRISGTSTELDATTYIQLKNSGFLAGTYKIMKYGESTELIGCRLAIKNTVNSPYRYVDAGQSVELSDFSEYHSIIVQWYVNKRTTVNAKVYTMLYQYGNDIYEPYKPVQSLTLATPNGLPGIKVTSGGNYTDATGQQWVCDRIIEKSGIIGIEKCIYEGILDGSSGHCITGRWGDGSFYINTLPVNSSGGYSDKFNYHKANLDHIEMPLYSFGYGGGASETVTFKLPSSIKTVEEANAWFKKNPAKFLLQKKNPTFTPLPQAEQNAIRKLHSDYPTTIITTDENAPVEITYVADTRNYILNREKIMQKQLADIQSALISQKISGGGYKSN